MGDDTAAPAYIVGSTVAFVFFPQVGLRMVLRRLEAVADRPAVPWSGRRVVRPYLQPSWSGSSGQRWDPLGPEQRQCHTPFRPKSKAWFFFCMVLDAQL
jgi:hypothetical protein